MVNFAAGEAVGQLGGPKSCWSEGGFEGGETGPWGYESPSREVLQIDLKESQPSLRYNLTERYGINHGLTRKVP